MTRRGQVCLSLLGFVLEGDPFFSVRSAPALCCSLALRVGPGSFLFLLFIFYFSFFLSASLGSWVFGPRSERGLFFVPFPPWIFS